MLFANATMHPAYGRLFFAQANVIDAAARQQVFDSAAVAINKLWQVVEAKLEHMPYLGGMTSPPPTFCWPCTPVGATSSPWISYSARAAGRWWMPY